MALPVLVKDDSNTYRGYQFTGANQAAVLAGVNLGLTVQGTLLAEYLRAADNRLPEALDTATALVQVRGETGWDIVENGSWAIVKTTAAPESKISVTVLTDAERIAQGYHA